MTNLDKRIVERLREMSPGPDPVDCERALQAADLIDDLTQERDTLAARVAALEAAAGEAHDYGEEQYAANVVNFPEYADAAQDDAQEIATAIRALDPAEIVRAARDAPNDAKGQT